MSRKGIRLFTVLLFIVIIASAAYAYITSSQVNTTLPTPPPVTINNMPQTDVQTKPTTVYLKNSGTGNPSIVIENPHPSSTYLLYP